MKSTGWAIFVGEGLTGGRRVVDAAGMGCGGAPVCPVRTGYIGDKQTGDMGNSPRSSRAVPATWGAGTA